LDIGSFTAVAAGGATILTSLSFESPGTLIRTRGMVSVFPQAAGADINVVGAFGIGIVSAEALSVGITAIPTPFTDADWGGWMVLQPFAFRLDVTSDIGRLISSLQIEVDSKAMRKVGPNTAAVVVAESLSGALSVADTTRLLLKLH